LGSVGIFLFFHHVKNLRDQAGGWYSKDIPGITGPSKLVMGSSPACFALTTCPAVSEKSGRYKTRMLSLKHVSN
jgi:hypothetical protein